MILTNKDLQAIRQAVREEVNAQRAGYDEWLADSRAQIALGATALANGEKVSGTRVFSDIRSKQTKRRLRRERA